MGIPASKCFALLPDALPLFSPWRPPPRITHCRPCTAAAGRGRQRRPHFPRYVTIRRNRTNREREGKSRSMHGRRRLAPLLFFLSGHERGGERAHRSFDCAAGGREEGWSWKAAAARRGSLAERVNRGLSRERDEQWKWRHDSVS